MQSWNTIVSSRSNTTYVLADHHFTSKWPTVWDHFLVLPTQVGKSWLQLSRARNFKSSRTLCGTGKWNVMLINAPVQVSYLTGLMLKRTNFQIKANAEFWMLKNICIKLFLYLWKLDSEVFPKAQKFVRLLIRTK